MRGGREGLGGVEGGKTIRVNYVKEKSSFSIKGLIIKKQIKIPVQTELRSHLR